jgi:arsenate reductase
MKIYHNPRCSKSRDALKYLQEKNFSLEIIDYINMPFSRDELTNIIKLLDISPRELLRKNEAFYKENNLSDKNITDSEIIDFMLKEPKLIERPIIVAEKKACIARPLEKLKEMLND